jgi:aldose 1-epimerase
MNEHFRAIQRDSASPWPGPRGEKVTYASDSLEVTVYPDDGCRITSIRVHGREILRQWSPERRGFQYGVFPMVPWVGRMGGGLLYWRGRVHQLPVNRPPHALHGCACFGPWTRSGVDEFSLELGRWWPWDARAVQRIGVNDSSLTLSLEIISNSGEFPAQAGWHPWFLRRLEGDSRDVLLGTHPQWQEELGGNELPTGRRIAPQTGPWDNCFGYTHQMDAELRWESVSARIGSDRRWSTLFTVPEDAVCVEPLSGPPNGINTAPESVAPDRPLTITTTWRLAGR